MRQDFEREVFSRLPLAQAVLLLWQYICDDNALDDLFDRHRGRNYEKKGSARTRVGNFHSFGSVQVRIFRRRYSSSRKP
jgi:hypothetical protein